MDMTGYSWISSPPGYPMARKYRMEIVDVDTGVPEYGLDQISIQSHPCCAPVKWHLHLLRTSSQISFPSELHVITQSTVRPQ